MAVVRVIFLRIPCSLYIANTLGKVLITTFFSLAMGRLGFFKPLFGNRSRRRKSLISYKLWTWSGIGSTKLFLTKSPHMTCTLMTQNNYRFRESKSGLGIWYKAFFKFHIQKVLNVNKKSRATLSFWYSISTMQQESYLHIKIIFWPDK